MFVVMVVKSEIGKCLFHPPPSHPMQCLLFWKCIRKKTRNIKTLTSIWDGVSPHLNFYRFHCPPGIPEEILIFTPKMCMLMTRGLSTSFAPLCIY